VGYVCSLCGEVCPCGADYVVAHGLEMGQICPMCFVLYLDPDPSIDFEGRSLLDRATSDRHDRDPADRRQRQRERRKYQEAHLQWIEDMVALIESDPELLARLDEWERVHIDGSTTGTSDWPGWADTPVGPCPRPEDYRACPPSA
jgi:hypothetical protein